MFKTRRFWKKIQSIVLVFVLLFNSFTFYASPFLAQNAYSAEESNTSVNYSKKENTAKLVIYANEPVNYNFIYRSGDKTDGVIGNGISDSGIITRDLFFGTCSDKDCVIQRPERIILKVHYQSSGTILTQLYSVKGDSVKLEREYSDKPYELTAEETAWLETGEFSENSLISTPTPTVVDPVPTPENQVSRATLSNVTSAAVTNSCIRELYGSGSLTCTANDVRIARVINYNVLDDGCISPQDTVTFEATYEVDSGANKRYDIGLYFSNDGDPDGNGALGGQCTIDSLTNTYNEDEDDCGDINADSPILHTMTVTASCLDANGDNQLDLPYCTTWDNNANTYCSGPLNTIPGAPSKCNCEPGFQVPITVPYFAEIEVVKDLVPATDIGSFNLLVDGTSEASCVKDDGTTQKVSVDAGTSATPNVFPTVNHTVGESACEGTNLADYDSTITCVDRGQNTFDGGDPLILSGTGPLTVPVQKDDDVVCTITNQVKQGNLTIIKDVQPDSDSGLFNLLIDDTVYATNVGDYSTGAIALETGSYIVSETEGTGTHLTDYLSVIDGDCDAQGNVIIGPGESKACTITNTRKTGTIKVNKLVDTDADGIYEGDNTIANNLGFAWGTDGATYPNQMGSSISVNTGNYSIYEKSVANYHFTGWFYANQTPEYSCANPNGTQLPVLITADYGLVNEITLCNSRDTAQLTLLKYVVNDNGGTATQNDFPVYINNVSSSWGAHTLLTGNYTVKEDSLTGYTPSAWGTDCASNGTITLNSGDDKTCTITNDDNEPSLTLVKELTTDHGGTASASDWTLTASGPTGFSGIGPTVSNGVSFDAGTYDLSESGPSGYDASDWVCTGGIQVDGDSVTIGLGQDVICTITNDDIAPSLTLVKQVTNNNGGLAQVSDFTLKADDTVFTSGVSQNVLVGTYTLSESGPSGYTPSLWSCAGTGTQQGSEITLVEGQSAICTISNDDQSATLVVKKVVINDDGGTLEPQDFTFSVNLNPAEAFEADGQNDLTVNSGTYSIAEPVVTGYSTTYDNCSDIFIPNGGTATCTITNDDVANTINVCKYEDLDGNGNVSELGTAKADVTINLYKEVSGNYEQLTTGTTGQNGCYQFADISQGNYRIYEELPTGYYQTYPVSPADYHQTSIGLDETQNFVFLNSPYRTISGHKYEDKNGNGMQDAGEPNLSGWTIYIDYNDNDTLDGGEPSTSTDVDREYEFSGLVSDTYIIREILQGSWQQTQPAAGSYLVDLHNAIVSSGNDFGNQAFGSVEVLKYHDKNANGIQDAGEEGLQDWDIVLGEVIQTTDSSGLTTFTVPVGDYILTENLQEGWYMSNIQCGEESTDSIVGLPMTVLHNQTLYCSIGNYTDGTVTIIKRVWDKDGNDIEDPTQFNFTFDAEQFALSDGQSQQFSKTPGIYPITETPVDFYDFLGCQVIVPQTDVIERLFNQITYEQNLNVVITSGESLTVECINQKQPEPKLVISKFNTSWPTSQDKGALVRFYITVTVEDNAVYNAFVTDVLPYGFTYQKGSWSAKKNSSDFTVSEPTYASPGVWTLGNLEKDDVVELTYLAKIGDAVTPGIYNDLAWAYGCRINESCSSTDETSILAVSTGSGMVDPGVIDENHVGTQVAVNYDQTGSSGSGLVETKYEGQVLGASTSLPATGANALWLILAFGTIGTGLVIMKKSKIKN
jgi:hypothetical protein